MGPKFVTQPLIQEVALRQVSVFFFMMFLICTGAWADPKSTAVEKGQALLQLLDQEKFAEAYQQGASVLRGALTVQQFSQQNQSAHQMVGKRMGRSLVKTSHHTELNNMKGDFYVLRFQSSYANLPQAAELLTVMQEGGHWKLGGYQIIKPEYVPKGF